MAESTWDAATGWKTWLVRAVSVLISRVAGVVTAAAEAAAATVSALALDEDPEPEEALGAVLEEEELEPLAPGVLEPVEPEGVVEPEPEPDPELLVTAGSTAIVAPKP